MKSLPYAERFVPFLKRREREGFSRPLVGYLNMIPGYDYPQPSASICVICGISVLNIDSSRLRKLSS